MNLQTTFSVLSPDMAIENIDVTPDVYEQLEQRFNGFRSHVLIASHSFTESWPTWEKHPNGDELVTLVSGRADFVLRTDEGDRAVTLSEPGEFVVVPRDTWHTAHISEPTVMIFITPGEGTENVETPP